MTARGELFVDEDIRDFVGIKKFDEIFGEDWRIDASRFSDVWREGELPIKDSVPIKNENNDIIGYLDFELKFDVAGDGFDKYLEPVILKAEIRKI